MRAILKGDLQSLNHQLKAAKLQCKKHAGSDCTYLYESSRVLCRTIYWHKSPPRIYLMLPPGSQTKPCRSSTAISRYHPTPSPSRGPKKQSLDLRVPKENADTVLLVCQALEMSRPSKVKGFCPKSLRGHHLLSITSLASNVFYASPQINYRKGRLFGNADLGHPERQNMSCSLILQMALDNVTATKQLVSAVDALCCSARTLLLVGLREPAEDEAMESDTHPRASH